VREANLFFLVPHPTSPFEVAAALKITPSGAFGFSCFLFMSPLLLGKLFLSEECPFASRYFFFLFPRARQNPLCGPEKTLGRFVRRGPTTSFFLPLFSPETTPPFFSVTSYDPFFPPSPDRYFSTSLRGLATPANSALYIPLRPPSPAAEKIE